MGRSKNGMIVFFLAFLILGIALSVQYRTILNINKQKETIAAKLEKTKSELDTEKSTKEQLLAEISQNEKKKQEYLKEFANQANDDKLNNDLKIVGTFAGLTNVKGSGIIISIKDNKVNTIGITENAKFLIIHDMDLVWICNELKKAGAQAMSINDERVISFTEQTCAGPSIRINNKRMTSPYEIRAIGDQELLSSCLDKSEIAKMMREFGINLDIVKEKEVFIPKYNGKLDDFISMLEVTSDETK